MRCGAWVQSLIKVWVVIFCKAQTLINDMDAPVALQKLAISCLVLNCQN